MKVALVYDRVNKWGGAELVLLALNEIFPKASLYTAVYDQKKAPWAKKFPKVVPSFLQKIPFAKDAHELLGAFTPIAFETFDFSRFDLVISVTSEAAKGIITKPKTLHICYCLTPTRYLWSGHDFYFKNPQGKLQTIPFFGQASRPFVSYAKYWDKIAAQRPDQVIAISTAVKKRIRKYYQRDSEIIFPPVDLDMFTQIKPTKREDFYLIVSRLEPYKRVDLAIKAFNKLGKKLVIVGIGGQERKLKAIARDNIFFAGELTYKEMSRYYKQCRGYVFPQEEDFGIVAVEAQAAGAPVIAYNAGGALDTVIEGKTGIFFNQQKKEDLIKAVKRFEEMRFDHNEIVDNAKKFSKERFKKEFRQLIKDVTKNL